MSCWPTRARSWPSASETTQSRPGAGVRPAESDARYVLTELILAEVVTRLRALAGAERGASVALSLLESRRYELLFADGGLLRGAIQRMARLRDKRLSLTDCVSFEVMDRLGLRDAFSFDRDFRDCGYAMVP